MKIKLELIEFQDLQVRAETDSATVRKYAEAMMTPNPERVFPPVVVYHDGAKYYLADGFHRMFATRDNGGDEIEADVLHGGREDAIWHAAGCNSWHGKLMTDKDKRRAVRMAIAVRPNESAVRYAQHIGVAQSFVSRIVKEIEAESKERAERLKASGPPEILCKDGVVRTNVGGRPSGKSGSVSVVASGSIADALGREIPPSLLETWKRAEAHAATVKIVSSALDAVLEIKDGEDKIWEESKLSVVISALAEARKFIQLVIPYAICPKCSGMNSVACQCCLGKGFVSRHKFDIWTTVDEETILRMASK